MHSHAHTPQSMYIVRPQYEYGMYKVTQSSQQSLPGYSCPAGHGMFTVILHLGPCAMPCCHAASVMSCHTELRHETRNKEWWKLVSNRPILHWPLTRYYTACMLHANFMHYTESDDQKLGGGGPDSLKLIASPSSCLVAFWQLIINEYEWMNTLLVPTTKKLGKLVSSGPHGCCAYVCHF